MQTEGRGGEEPFTLTIYAYDFNNRLEKEIKKYGKTTETHQYRYDENGNETFRIWEKCSPNPEYPGKVSLSGGWRRTNPTVYEWRQYNGFDQLIRIVQDNGEITYQYRGDGLRHSREVKALSEREAKTDCYYWDGLNLAAEQRDGGKLRCYLRGLNLIASQQDGMVYYYLSDAHGDVVWLRDQNGGGIRFYEYDAFGNEKERWEEDENPFRYCGEYVDVSSGTYYLRARSYRPTTGRFLTEDPINAGLNWYCYCENDPVNRIDPWGLDSYLYYDPNTHSYTNDYITIHQQSLAEQFYNGDINKVHLISLESTSSETSDQIFIREWGAMAKDISIESIVFHGHANRSTMNLSSNDGFRVFGSNSQMYGSLSVNINKLDKIETDYFILLGCNPGEAIYDYNGSNKGATNLATEIVLGKHKVNNAVIASDGKTTTGSDGILNSDGDGYRSFLWNSGTKTVDTFYLGHKMNSVSDLIKTQIVGSRNPSLYQTTTNIPSISRKKKKKV